MRLPVKLSDAAKAAATCKTHCLVRKGYTGAHYLYFAGAALSLHELYAYAAMFIVGVMVVRAVTHWDDIGE